MREIRSYGSVRGVRSNPYPYRDTPPTGAAGTEKPHYYLICLETKKTDRTVAFFWGQRPSRWGSN